MMIDEFKKLELPDNPGVYYFKQGKEILYVGKATSLRDRVRSYFSSDLHVTRGMRLVKMLQESDTITWRETPSVLEALILEAFEIRTHQPVYNAREKDDKSYNYMVVTEEKFPRILIERERNLLGHKETAFGGKPESVLIKGIPFPVRSYFGPFPNGAQLREALKIVRRIFPFRDIKCTPAEEQTLRVGQAPRPCFNRQIGMCPGVCTGEISAKAYDKVVATIELFFSGETGKVRKNLEREMKHFIRDREFEKAGAVKRTLFALDHIHDVSLIKSDDSPLTTNDQQLTTAFRIEAYDIAHIGGSATVGVMVVIEDGEVNKNEYRKFRIRGSKGKVTVDDTKNLKEVLRRRLSHAEWPLPNLIVIDGSTAQLNAAQEILKERGFDIELLAVVKDSRHKAREVIGKKSTLERYERQILLLNAEAHRFAIAYHRKRRSTEKGF